MKHLFTTAAVLFSMTAFAQVGINNTSPKATLDITAKTSGTKPEGLIIPQLAGSDIHTATAAGVYGSAQKGLIIYATSADSSPISATANITTAGYYYFDGTNWQKISTGNTVSTSLASGNIYVGSASNVATAVNPTGDVTISNTGATSIGAGKVTTTHLANNAVTVAKLPAGATATTFLRGDGTWVTPTDTNTTYTAGTGLTLTGTSFSANDATATTKGIIQLAGDLAGPVAAPTITSGAVTSAKIADGAVTASKLNQMSATSGQVLGWNGTAWAPTANGISTTLNNGNILVGNASNVATAVSPTGDVAISNAGITSIGTGKVTTAHLANNAVTVAKLPAGATATTFLRGDGTWVTPTDTNTTYTAGTGLTLTGTSFSANDATTTTKGIIQLAGDLAGPVAAPTIASGAVTSAKIADGTIANGDLNTGVGGIYKGSGALSGGNTSVDLGTNNLSFTSGASAGTSHFTVDGTTLNVDAVNNRVGIGTSTPGNLLEISSSSSNTGLKLPYGAAAGKILTSDAAGNSSWQTNNAVFIYSEVHATGSSQSFTTGNKVTFFHNIKGENIKAIYGNSYGWIDATQRWIAPYTGKYRVTTNMYFNNSSGTNPRLYAYLNGSTTCNITSATNNGSTDGTAYTSAIVSLNQNDYIEWKIPPGCTCFNATLFGADYYTFIRVESVE